MPESEKLSPDEIQSRLRSLPGWRAVDGRLEKEFPFPDFAQALAFTNAVGAIAEEMQHHPDIHVSWGKARIVTWTHDAGGVTGKDVALALRVEQRA